MTDKAIVTYLLILNLCLMAANIVLLVVQLAGVRL